MGNLPQTQEEYRRWWREQCPDIPYGSCWCGCGQLTTTSPQTTPHKLLFRTEPKRYIAGHQMRSTPNQYRVEDCGYKTPCWVWQWSTTLEGYAEVRAESKTQRAHRVFYKREYGPIPKSKELDHLCAPFGGPRNCVRPDHLEPVTHRENLSRGRGAKLSLKRAEAMRAMWRSGLYDQGQIAALFDVRRDTANKVINGHCWASPVQDANANPTVH